MGAAPLQSRARELTRKALVEAMRSGDFYASTGVELEDLSMAGGSLRLKIKQVRPTSRNSERYSTSFIGRGGQVLKIDSSLEPSYELKPEDLYIRARVVSSNGAMAWTQPLFAPGKGSFE